jgi:hypothetical protein
MVKFEGMTKKAYSNSKSLMEKALLGLPTPQPTCVFMDFDNSEVTGSFGDHETSCLWRASDF